VGSVRRLGALPWRGPPHPQLRARRVDGAAAGTSWS